MVIEQETLQKIESKRTGERTGEVSARLARERMEALAKEERLGREKDYRKGWTKDQAPAEAKALLDSLIKRYNRTKTELKWSGGDIYLQAKLKAEIVEVRELARELAHKSGLPLGNVMEDFAPAKPERKEAKMNLERLHQEMLGHLLDMAFKSEKGPEIIDGYLARAEKIHRDAGLGESERHLLKPFHDAKIEHNKKAEPIGEIIESDLEKSNPEIYENEPVITEYTASSKFSRWINKNLYSRPPEVTEIVARRKLAERMSTEEAQQKTTSQKPGLNWLGMPNKARRAEIREAKEKKQDLLEAKDSIKFLASQFRNTLADLEYADENSQKALLGQLENYKKGLEKTYTDNTEALRRDPEIINALKNVGATLSPDQENIYSANQQKIAESGESETKTDEKSGGFKAFLRKMAKIGIFSLTMLSNTTGFGQTNLNKNKVEQNKYELNDLIKKEAKAIEKLDEQAYLEANRKKLEGLLEQKRIEHEHSKAHHRHHEASAHLAKGSAEKHVKDGIVIDNERNKPATEADVIRAQNPRSVFATSPEGYVETRDDGSTEQVVDTPQILQVPNADTVVAQTEIAQQNPTDQDQSYYDESPEQPTGPRGPNPGSNAPRESTSTSLGSAPAHLANYSVVPNGKIPKGEIKVVNYPLPADDGIVWNPGTMPKKETAREALPTQDTTGTPATPGTNTNRRAGETISSIAPAINVRGFIIPPDPSMPQILSGGAEGSNEVFPGVRETLQNRVDTVGVEYSRNADNINSWKLNWERD